MRECTRHAVGSHPRGGVCPSCLEEKLTLLWRGERIALDDIYEIPGTSSAPADLSSCEDPAITTVESIASIRKQLQVNGVVTRMVVGRDTVEMKVDDMSVKKESAMSSSRVFNEVDMVGNALSPLKDKALNGEVNGVKRGESRSTHLSSESVKDVMKEWADFHANRRRNTATSLSTTLEFPKAEGKHLAFVKPIFGLGNPTAAQGIGCHSMPLLNSSAEETALRVISEEPDDYFSKELEVFGSADSSQDRDGSGSSGALHENAKQQACFSPVWQGKLSSKWVKVLVNPVITRNKVFPSKSKEDVRKAYLRSRKGSSPAGATSWDHQQAFGCAPPSRKLFYRLDRVFSRGHTERVPAQTVEQDTSGDSVLSWLQKVPNSETPLINCQPEEFTSANAHADPHFNDLTTVGHLHEIAEELEIFEESSDDEDLSASLSDSISSFGKFLVIAAQRQPKAGLTRVLSASTSV